MATTTPNFGWAVPTSTDLVKDGAVAIETLGDAIDASLVDLKGGTTGQVLAKASGTDMDFTWTTDASGISPTIFAAKGDLLGASANDTPAVLAVGNNGETLVADSSTSTGLRYQGNYAAGKNKIINGDFGVWQRGTSTSTNYGYTSDRWLVYRDGSGTVTTSQQTFTPGTAPVAGYEGQYFLRLNQTVAGTGGTENLLQQPIEDVRTFAGQTISVSFWAKADSARTLQSQIQQYFGGGGSARVDQTAVSHSVTTSWQRFSTTFTVPSIAGKTIGTGSYLTMVFRLPNNAVQTFDIWGVQVEAGSTATAFQTATGTIQGELAACQRYYMRFGSPNITNVNETFGTGNGLTTTSANIVCPFPVQMRVAPTAVDFSTLRVTDMVLQGDAVTSVTLSSTENGRNAGKVQAAISPANLTVNRMYFISANGSTNGFIGFSAEL